MYSCSQGILKPQRCFHCIHNTSIITQTYKLLHPTSKPDPSHPSRQELNVTRGPRFTRYRKRWTKFGVRRQVFVHRDALTQDRGAGLIMGPLKLDCRRPDPPNAGTQTTMSLFIKVAKTREKRDRDALGLFWQRSSPDRSQRPERQTKSRTRGREVAPSRQDAHFQVRAELLQAERHELLFFFKHLTACVMIIVL